jgi:hypothetical protein
MKFTKAAVAKHESKEGKKEPKESKGMEKAERKFGLEKGHK